MHGEFVTRRMLDAWTSGETFAEIAARHGVSKQAVHARIRRVAEPSHRQANRRAREARRLREAAQAAQAQEAAAREAGRVCAIPGCDAVVSGARRTCSAEHAAAWRLIGRSVDAGQNARHRVTQARYRLRHPERYSEADLAWARAVLSDDPPPPNRRFRQKGSQVARVLAELGR